MGRVRTHGRSIPFRQRSWDDIDELFAALAEQHASFRHMSDIVKSVISSNRTDALAACTSMHDVIVVPTPIAEPPYGVVIVRAPDSIRELAKGIVRIEHLSVTGHDEIIDRPVDAAVPLFWRFMIEKYGVDPGPHEPTPDGRQWPTS